MSLYYGAAKRRLFTMGKTQKSASVLHFALLPRQNTLVTKLLCHSAFVRRSALISLGCTITRRNCVCCARVHFCTFRRHLHVCASEPTFFGRMPNYHAKLRICAFLRRIPLFSPLFLKNYGGVHICPFLRRNPLFSVECPITMGECAFAHRNARLRTPFLLRSRQIAANLTEEPPINRWRRFQPRPFLVGFY